MASEERTRESEELIRRIRLRDFQNAQECREILEYLLFGGELFEPQGFSAMWELLFHYRKMYPDICPLAAELARFLGDDFLPRLLEETERLLVNSEVDGTGSALGLGFIFGQLLVFYEYYPQEWKLTGQQAVFQFLEMLWSRFDFDGEKQRAVGEACFRVQHWNLIRSGKMIWLIPMIYQIWKVPEEKRLKLAWPYEQWPLVRNLTVSDASLTQQILSHLKRESAHLYADWQKLLIMSELVPDLEAPEIQVTIQLMMQASFSLALYAK